MITKVNDSEILSNLKQEITVVVIGMYAHEVVMLNNSLEGLFYFNHCLN